MDLATSEEETSEEETDTSGIIDQSETSIKASFHRIFALQLVYNLLMTSV